MCRVPATGSLPVLRVACSLAPWRAARMLPSFFFCRRRRPERAVVQLGRRGVRDRFLRLAVSYFGGCGGRSSAHCAYPISRLLRRPSDPRTATVTASKRGGCTLILDILPTGRGYTGEAPAGGGTGPGEYLFELRERLLACDMPQLGHSSRSLTGPRGPTRRDSRPPPVCCRAMPQLRWTPSKRLFATPFLGAGNPL